MFTPVPWRQLQSKHVESGNTPKCDHLCAGFLSGSSSASGVLKVPSGRCIVCRKCAGCDNLKRSRAPSWRMGLNRRLGATPVRSLRVRNHACRGA